MRTLIRKKAQDSEVIGNGKLESSLRGRETLLEAGLKQLTRLKYSMDMKIGLL